MRAPIEVTFLVVGAGPAGLTAAHVLTALGQPSLVVERRDAPRRQPAAHVVNARSLEILRQAGLDMDAIDALAHDPVEAGHVNYVTRLNGQLIGRLPFERQGPEVLALTPTPLRNISQHHLEPLLAEAAGDRRSCDLRYDTAWVSSEQDAAGVTSTLRHLPSGDEYTVRSRYLIAADGAASPVRVSLGISMVGPSSLQSYRAIHFRANLRAVVAERPGVLHFTMDPAASGVFVAHGPDDEWVFMASEGPGRPTRADDDADRCRDIVRAAIGDDTTPIELLDVGSWHMSAQVAESMRDRRVFLVGDAAHRFPPTGGLGLNTGVADAHGLAWRLAAVERGWAAPSLLDSYEVERRPVAATNCEQSTTNAFKLLTLVEALGIDSEPTSAALLATLADPARHAAIEDAVAEQATHFDMIGLQLGYCYREGAVDRGDTEPPPDITDPRVFEPDAAVGCRLPHAWLADGRSTLDLVDLGHLTLFSFGDHPGWAASLAEIDAPSRHIRVDRDVEVCGAWDLGDDIGDGALLVRPDQHIAWRSNTAAESIDLAAVTRSLLGR